MPFDPLPRAGPRSHRSHSHITPGHTFLTGHFFNWLYKEGYTTENRLARLKPPKAPQKLVEVLTNDEVSRVLRCPDANGAAGARNHTILVLLLDTGLRCSKLMSTKLKNVNIEGGYLKVLGKGSKERIVPSGATAQKALLRYLLHFRPEPFNVAIQNLFPHFLH